MKKIFKLAEFFSGPGGMAYGAGLSKAIDKKKILSQLSTHGHQIMTKIPAEHMSRI